MSYFKTCHMRAVHGMIISSYEIDEGHALIQNLSESHHLLDKGSYSQSAGRTKRATVVAWVVLRAVCVAPLLYTGAYMRCGLAAFREICAVGPLPLFLDSSPTSNLRIYIPPPAKGRTILAFHFPVQGFSFFADKCSPIHPDRCHIASLPF